MTTGRLALRPPAVRQDAPATEAHSGSELIGRSHELSRVQSHWLRARAGQSESVLVRGEPGIGKSCFVRRFTAQLPSAETWVLTAPGRVGTDVPPLWPWIQVTRQLQRLCPDALTGAEPVVAAFEPWLARVVIVEPGGNGFDKPTHFQLIDNLTQLIISSAHRTPVCLVLEDLHDFDAQSLAVVRELLTPAGSSALLVLGTCRTAAALYAGEQLTSVLERFEHCLQLSGLRSGEVAELMALKLRRPVSMALARRVHRRTDGNPLYVRALSSVLEAAPRGLHNNLDVDGIRLPDSLRRAGSRQLHGLSPACRRTLEAAAILGREFELSELAQMLGQAGPRSVDAQLDEAVRDGIVCPVTSGVGADRYRFSHALLHEWLREELSPEARARAHRQAADVLFGPSEPDPCRAFAAASHLLQAGDRESLARAARAAEQAGCHARERGADAECAESFKLAVSAWQQQLRAAEAPAHVLQRQLAHALLEMSDAQWRSGQQPAALAGLSEVADIAASLDEPELLVQAALVTLDHCNVVLAPEQQKLCELACAQLDRVSAQWRVQLAAHLGVQRCLSRDRTQGLQLIQLARDAYAQAEGDPQAELALRYAELFSCDPNAPLPQRRALLDRYGQTASVQRHAAASVWAEFCTLQCAIEAADPDAVLHHERALAYATRRVGTRLNWLHDTLRWTLAFLRGQFDEAKRLLPALAPQEHHAGSTVAILHVTAKLSLARVQGDPLPAIESLAGVGDTLLRIPEFTAALASLHAEQGELAQARVELTRALLQCERSIMGDCHLALAARELNDAVSGARLYTQLLPFERRFAVLPGGVLCIGAVAHYVGLAACAAGHLRTAVTHFETAIELNRAMGALPALARTHYELARTLHATGAPKQADEHARIALQLATALGMRPLVQRAAEQCNTEHAAASGSDEEAIKPTPPPAPARAENQWRKRGTLWKLSYAGHDALLVHCKGLGYIAKLLERPGQEVHVLELIGSQSEPAPARHAHDDALSTRAGLEGYEPQLDATCMARYRKRLHALEQELTEARRHVDLGRCERLEAERELLLSELAQGARARNRPVERARKAVYNRIRDIIRQLEDVHPSLARHLQASVHTGVNCSYRPEQACHWAVS